MKSKNNSRHAKSKSFGSMGKKAPRHINHDLNVFDASKPKKVRVNKRPKALRGMR